jgi:hypothetical protein
MPFGFNKSGLRHHSLLDLFSPICGALKSYDFLTESIRFYSCKEPLLAYHTRLKNNNSFLEKVETRI